MASSRQHLTRPSGSNTLPGLGVKHDESDHALDLPDGDVVVATIPLVKRPARRPRRGEQVLGMLQGYALIDPQDVRRVEGIPWRLTEQGYAASSAAGLLHRYLLGLPVGDALEVDHINGNKLDCRRVNMRVVTHAENTQNVPSQRGSSSRHRGVSWDRRRRRWEAYVQVAGRKHHLGRFRTEAAAADAAAIGRAKLMTHHNEDRSVAHV